MRLIAGANTLVPDEDQTAYLTGFAIGYYLSVPYTPPGSVPRLVVLVTGLDTRDNPNAPGYVQFPVAEAFTTAWTRKYDFTTALPASGSNTPISISLANQDLVGMPSYVPPMGTLIISSWGYMDDHGGAI